MYNDILNSLENISIVQEYVIGYVSDALFDADMKSDKIDMYQETRTSLDELKQKEQSQTKMNDAGKKTKIEKCLRSHIRKDGVRYIFEMNKPVTNDDIENEAFNIIKDIIYQIKKNFASMYKWTQQPTASAGKGELDKYVKEFFKLLGVKNGELHHIVFEDKVTSSNFLNNDTNRVSLSWWTGFANTIYKPSKNVRFFHSTSHEGITELKPTRVNAAGNHLYPSNLLFFMAVDFSDFKSKKAIDKMLSYFGTRIYEYIPKPSDVFYIDKNAGSIDPDYPAVILKSDNPVPVKDVTNTIKSDMDKAGIPNEDIGEELEKALQSSKLLYDSIERASKTIKGGDDLKDFDRLYNNYKNRLASKKRQFMNKYKNADASAFDKLEDDMTKLYEETKKKYTR